MLACKATWRFDEQDGMSIKAMRSRAICECRRQQRERVGAERLTFKLCQAASRRTARQRGAADCVNQSQYFLDFSKKFVYHKIICNIQTSSHVIFINQNLFKLPF